MVVAVVVAASSVGVWSASPATAAQPVIGGTGTFPYLEGAPAIAVGTGITVASGASYAGQYVQFGVSGASPWEVLHLPTDGSPVITNGVVSIVGADVFLGNGATAEQIGEVDATLDGTAGKVLRVNFSSTFQNPGFETADMTSWTALNQRIDLGVDSIAGCPTVDTGTYPGNDSGQDNRVPINMGSYTTAVDSTDHSSGAYSLRLLSTGITTASGWDVVHGPAVFSSTFDANAGDVIDFDWQAKSGSDAEDVFGYIINTATCARTVVLDHTGNSTSGSTSWATVSTNIPATGTYRFVFVSGTYDLSGGQAAGASLYIDNVRVYGTKATDAVVEQIARRLTYANSGSFDLPATRTITVTAKSATTETATANITVNITPQDEAPVYLDDTLGVFHFNQSYSDAVTTRAWPLATYTLTGATPTGVTFDLAAATFTGTPTVADETYDFTVTAHNRAGDTPRHYSGTVQTAPIIFTDSDTGVFVLDRAHSNAIATNGFPAPSYVLTGGALPAGISFSSSGAFTGTPTQGLAPYSFTITSTNIEGSLSHLFSGTVETEPTLYTDSDIGQFVLGTPHNNGVHADGLQTPTYAVTSGILPPGLVLNSTTGVITGTPTATGPFGFWITASNAHGSISLHLTGVVASIPAFTDSALANFSTDDVYTDAVSATGYPAATYSITGGVLPAGITLNPTTGAVTGTPTGVEAPYSFTISATNVGGSVSVLYTGTVRTEPRAFTDGTLPQFVVATAVVDGVVANGFPAPTYSITSGIIPGGLSLNLTTGAVTGAPTTTGTYSFEITATNSEGTLAKTFTGVVASTPAFTDSALANFSTDGVYADGVSASGYPAPTYTVSSGLLPAGITLNASTGALSGTPTGVEAPYSFTIRASNLGGSVSVPYTGTVRTEPRAFTDNTIAQLVLDAPVADGVIANGFPAPTYSITSGDLPVGLNLNLASGAITGTPTVGGPFSFEITATNSEGTLAMTFTGGVAYTPAFTDSTLANFGTDDVYTDAVSATGYPAVTYSLTAGALPTGVTLNSSTGAITGTPTDIEAPYSFEITATNSRGSVNVTFTGTVHTEPRAWTDDTLVQFVLGTPVVDGVTANGFPAPTYTITNGSLPTGLTLNLTTGAITGTPTAGELYSFEITASNIQGTLVTTFSGTVAFAPSFTDSTLANFSTGDVYADGVATDGYPAPTYTVSTGTLPAGVTLNPTTGALTGTPTGIEAQYSFEITASNFVGLDVATFTGTVRTEPRSFTDGDVQELVVGSALTDGVTASGFPAPTYTITSGLLPAGLTLDLTTGTITGTPTVAGLYGFEISATNSEGTLAKSFNGRVFREDRGYLGLNPGRLFDSRDTNTPVEAGSVTEITVIGRFGVPADARAAVLNITVTEASATGYATVYPCGIERPLVSNLNFARGETVSNAVTTDLGTDGKICIFTTAGTHLVVDVNGAFSPTQGVGQLLPLAPSRLFDSRDTSTLLAAGSVTELEVTNHGGVPANAGAVVLNVTVTEPADAGYVTVYPCGSERPLASNINFVAGQTVPKAVTAAIGQEGRVCVFTSVTTHLVVDINGAFSLDGLGRLQGITPNRLLDTRDGSKPAAGAVHVLSMGGQGSIPANTMAVVLNVTVTESDAAGFATVYPCEAGLPLASNVNFVPGQTVPNAVTASLDSSGQVCIYVSAGAHVIVDINGIYIP